MTTGAPLSVATTPRPWESGWSADQGLRQVESLIGALCQSQEPLGAMVLEHLRAGGRRLRARLALETLDALGGDRLSGVGWAAACELLHNASLIHDDLQDGDRMRRGREALWVRHGQAQAINAGDLCLALATSAVASVPVTDGVRWQLALALSSAVQAMTRGQALEQSLLDAHPLDWNAYHHVVQGKTAALVALPVRGAAMICGCSSAECDALTQVFQQLGVLFQLQDDVVDLFGDKGRDGVGSDLREGKVSALVVEHLRLHPSQARWLIELLRLPRKQTTNQAVDQAIVRFKQGGALGAVWQRMNAIQRAAQQAPVVQGRPQIRALVKQLVHRALLPIAHTAPNALQGAS